MKKSMLYTGIAYLSVGLLCFALAALSEWKIESLLWGLGGAGVCPGLMMIWKYFHWTKPENQEEYAKRQQKARIELRDERKAMLRDKSGRIAYLFMMLLDCLLMLLLAFCICMGWFMPFALYAILGLLGLLVLQYLCSLAAFHYLSRKY